jgi:vancomycin resistance protein VanW
MNYWKEIKRTRKVVLRFLKDLWSKDLFRFTRSSTKVIPFEHALSLRQEIKKNETFESKVFNFKEASKQINTHVIMPNEIFSFWHIIGNPERQFKKGRTIQNGKIIEEVGGGLCQVSGIIYHMSLIGGLKVIERYNHSVDIYSEESRFCPLGTDATIVYGYKDLRVQNTHAFPIQFEMEVREDTFLQVKLLSTLKLEENKLIFNIENSENGRKVQLFNEDNQLLSTSNYKIIPELIS